MQDEETQVCGLVVIDNLFDVGLVHARNMDHRAAKLLTSLIQVLLLLNICDIFLTKTNLLYSGNLLYNIKC